MPERTIIAAIYVAFDQSDRLSKDLRSQRISRPEVLKTTTCDGALPGGPAKGGIRVKYDLFQHKTRSVHKPGEGRIWRRAILAAVACLMAVQLAPGVMAQEQEQEQEAVTEAPSQETTQIAVELNKLETIESGCRIYVVVDNKSETDFKTLKLDLVLFRTDGIVDQRFFVDLAPLRNKKRIVKLFELNKVACDDIGSFLVNDVVECRSETENIDGCLARMSVSSLAKAPLTK